MARTTRRQRQAGRPSARTQGGAALDLASKHPPTTEEGAAVGVSHGTLSDTDVDRAAAWQLPKRWETMETMATDPLVAASLSALTYPVLASKLQVEPASDRPEDRELADFVEQGLHNMTTGLQRHRAETLACVGEGVRVFEVVYERREDGHWHPRKLALRPNKTLTEWHLDDHGGPDGVTQSKPRGGSSRLTMDQILAFTHLADGPSLLGRPAMRAMYRPWTILDKLARVAAIGFYRNSVGVPWAKYEGGSSTEAGKIDRALMALGAAEKTFFRTDKDVTEWGIKGTDGELKDPVTFMEYQRRDLFLASLAQFLALGTDGTGSYALSQDQSGVYMLAVRFIAEEIEDAYNRHLIPAWLGYNFAELPKDRLPRVKHGVIDQRNTLQWAQSVAQMVAAGIELPKEELRQTAARLLGVTIPDETAPEDEAPDVVDVNDPNAPEATDGAAVEQADRGIWAGVDLAAGKLTILNTSVLTTYGVFEYTPLSATQAAGLVADGEWQSAIGHEATAEVLTELLGVDVPMNRVDYVQRPGDRALVFKLKKRAPEGTVLTREQIEALGYEFGLLVNTGKTDMSFPVDFAAKRLESEIKLEALGIAVNFEGMSRALDEGRDRIIERVGALQARQARRLVAIGKRVASGKPVRVGGQSFEGKALVAALLTGDVDGDAVLKLADQPRLVYYDEEAEVIEDELWGLYGSGWAEAGTEIEQQGGEAPEPEEDDGPSRAAVAGGALIMAALIADRMQVAWATEMARQLGQRVYDAAALGAVLIGGRLLTDQASRLANGAFAGGRSSAMTAAGVDGVMLSAVMDLRTCGPCARLDGTVHPRDTAPTVPLDVCHGGDMCRCQWIPLLASDLKG